MSVRPDLPTGTVTFVFTDIEGSTALLQDLGERYGALQADHMRLMREAIAGGGGTEVNTEGDAFFAVFPTAVGAVRAAVTAQRALAAHDWPHGDPLRVRMGIHTGEGRLGGDDYVGIDVNRAARIAAAGHGGQILLSDATRGLVEGTLPEGTALRGLGSHRLKDFPEPERVHDVVIEGLPSDFPPLTTLETPTNLPDEVTSFVGRERELDEVKGLLGSGRLVTLTGPAGSGKTRLALRAASELLDAFPDGVLVVDLASIDEPELVPGAIASVVGARELGPMPIQEVLRRELRHRTALLLLDNFEQVIGAAPGVGALLAAAPQVRFLVTSTGPLRIRGEQQFPVRPLHVPDPDRVPPPEAFARHAALALFVERATSVDPGFAVDEGNAATIAEICRRLDGLPLAIELAASRLGLLTPKTMLERLDRALPLLAAGPRDLPARQRTLRGAIGWSYDLLAPEIAALFRRVCVFAGGFTLEAAAAVCEPEGELGLDELEGLEALLHSSLLGRRKEGDELRFQTLQTVREFGEERLEEEGEAPPVRDGHARYFLRLAEGAEAGLRGPELSSHLATLELEHDNLRTALSWAIERDQGEVGLRLIRALWRFWYFHGDLTVGRRWANQVLSLPSAADRTTFRARAVIAAGSLAYWQKDYDAVVEAYREGLAIFRDLGDPGGVAEGTYNLAYIPLIGGRVEDAVEMFRSAREMFEDLGDRHGVADSLFGLSVASRMRGDLAGARATAEESLRISRELGDPYGMTGARYVLGRAAAESRDVETARRHLLETLDAAEGLWDRAGMAITFDNMAAVETARGDTLRAVRLAGASEGIKEAVGGEGPPELVDLPDVRTEARRSISEEEIEAAWNEGRSMSLEEALSYAREES